MAVHLTVKPARFDASAKQINGLQEPLTIEWEKGPFEIHRNISGTADCTPEFALDEEVMPPPSRRWPPVTVGSRSDAQTRRESVRVLVQRPQQCAWSEQGGREDCRVDCATIGVIESLSIDKGKCRVGWRDGNARPGPTYPRRPGSSAHLMLVVARTTGRTKPASRARGRRVGLVRTSPATPWCAHGPKQ